MHAGSSDPTWPTRRSRATNAFGRSPTERATETLDYSHRGRFSYTAAAPDGPVYEGGQVRTGDPVFLRLVQRLAVEFAYELDADGARSVTGSIALHAEIEGGNGWRHELVLGEAAAFGGTTGTARAELDIARIGAITDEVELRTGVDSGSYAVTVVPHVAIDATVGDQPLEDRIEPRLAFQLDDQQLRLTEPASEDEAADPLTPATDASLSRSTDATAHLSFRDWAVPVPVARWGAAVLGGLGAFGALIGAAVLRRRLRSEVARIELRYGDRLVPIAAGGDERGRLIVDVTTTHDLARLAQQHDALILQHRTEHRSAFFFEADGRIYRYTERHRHLETVAG